MKSVSSCIVIINIFCITCPAPSPGVCGPFQDVEDKHWACDAITELVELGVIAENEQFSPQDDITRAEWLKMLVVALKSRSRAGFTLCEPLINPFPDVPTSSWYAPYIDYAKAQGIVEGAADGLFYPESPVNRAETAVLIIRALKLRILAPINNQDYFVDTLPSWASSAVVSAKLYGLIEGMKGVDCQGNSVSNAGQRYYCPANTLRRAEAAAIVSRLLSYIPEPHNQPADSFAADYRIDHLATLIPQCPGDGWVQATLSRGHNLFKFEARPGYHYSFTLDVGKESTTRVLLQGKNNQGLVFSTAGMAIAAPRPTLGEIGNYDHGMTALMFFSEPAGNPVPYYSYARVWSETNIQNLQVRVMETSAKIFSHPLRKINDRDAVWYHNAFGHRDLASPPQVSTNGHDGVDLLLFRADSLSAPSLPLSPSFIDINDNGPGFLKTACVLPAADGYITKIDTTTPNLAEAGIWVYHPSVDKTTAYVHLLKSTVPAELEPICTGALHQQCLVNRQVYIDSGACLGYYRGHLHFEFLPNRTTSWSNGYSCGTTCGAAGQEDPFNWIFSH